MFNKKVKKTLFLTTMLCAVLLGSLIGSSGALATITGPYNLSPGWNNLPASGGITYSMPGVYSFKNQNSLYSSSDDIWVESIRMYNGTSQDPSGEFGPTYLWADDDSNYVMVYGFAGFLIQGHDSTTYQRQWFNDIQQYLVLQQTTWTWWPNGFTIAYEGWMCSP
jgi:hypothetical protein